MINIKSFSKNPTIENYLKLTDKNRYVIYYFSRLITKNIILFNDIIKYNKKEYIDMDENIFDKNISDDDEKKDFLDMIRKSYTAYIEKTSRSTKKINIIHSFFVNKMSMLLKNTNYTVKTECKISSENYSKNKKCDIVIFDVDNKPRVIFCIKFIMSSYYKNRNNYYENLTGEVCHLRWSNPDISIIPINISFNSLPVLDKNGKIKAYESVYYDSSFGMYDNLVKRNIINYNASYIIDVEYKDIVGDKLVNIPKIIDTSYITIKDILLKTNIFKKSA